jgi:hypothetical protein
MMMRFGQCWDVPDEFWILWWRSRELRTLRMHVDVEPASKGAAGKRSAPEFQRQVMDQMERYGRYPMTGPVALDLHFQGARRNPPGIHRAAKYTLDILGAALPGCERPRRRSVLYRDDRQVKFLYADLDQSWPRNSGENGRTGSVSIVARRARDVIDDLCMAGRLDHERHGEDDDSPFLSPDFPDDPEPDWLTEPDSVLTPLEQYLAEAFRFHDVTELQEAILAGTDASLISAVGMYLEGQARADPPGQLAAIFEESRAAGRKLLLSDPFTLPLPALPRAAGESEDFARLIRARLEEFRSGWPLFRSLLVPVTLTFLVVPPEQGKDLDNIALTALPIAHEVLRPHIAPHLLAPSHRDREPDPWREETLARLRSVNARSVRAYQVIELPRSPQDPPPEGTLRLALGRHSYRSWWARAATYLGKAIEQADKRGDLANSSWKSVLTS